MTGTTMPNYPYYDTSGSDNRVSEVGNTIHIFEHHYQLQYFGHGYVKTPKPKKTYLSLGKKDRYQR